MNIPPLRMIPIRNIEETVKKNNKALTFFPRRKWERPGIINVGNDIMYGLFKNFLKSILFFLKDTNFNRWGNFAM